MPPTVSSVPHHPHDAFFKEVFADPANARQLIQRHAPPELVALLDLDTLETFDTGFIDEDLRQHFADLSFRAKLKQGSEAYICLLLEHKSYPDKWVALQLVRYELQILDNLRQQGAQHLPAIFPMVVYHGRRRWRVSKQLHGLFDLTGLQSIRQYVPNFKYHLFDLTALDDNSLSEDGLVNAALGAMKHIFDNKIQTQLGQILRRLRGLPRDQMQRAIQIVLRYIMTGATHLTRADFEHVVNTEIDEQLQEGMMTLAQQLILEGKQVGLIEGKQVGLIEGKQVGMQMGLLDITQRQLRRRFGQIPVPIAAKLEHLSASQLADFGEALLDFTSLVQVQAWLENVSTSETHHLN